MNTSYPYKRTWGLITVTGATTKTLTATTKTACQNHADRALVGSCVDWLCQHFEARCHAWLLLERVSFGTMGLIGIGIVLLIVALMSSINDRLLSKQFALRISIFALPVLTIALITYFLGAITVFNMANRITYYQKPHLSLSYMVTTIGALIAGAFALMLLSETRSIKRKVKELQGIREQIAEVRSRYNIEP